MTFHEQHNAGKFGEIYDGRSDDLRATAARDELLRTIKTIREKLGLIRATERTGFNARADSQGTFVELEYEFENGAGTEGFTWEIADGRAKPRSYGRCWVEI